jgi:hypothetical protein
MSGAQRLADLLAPYQALGKWYRKQLVVGQIPEATSRFVLEHGKVWFLVQI